MLTMITRQRRGALEQIRSCLRKIDRLSGQKGVDTETKLAVEDLKVLIDACTKNNFVGIENPMLYSETYYGTKNLVQEFIDEGTS